MPRETPAGALTEGQDGCWKPGQECRLEWTPQEPEDEEPRGELGHILWVLKLSCELGPSITRRQALTHEDREDSEE